MFASSPRISQKRDRRQSIAYNLTDPVTRVYIAAPSDANGGHCRLVGRHRDSEGYSSACLSGRGGYATSAIANWERHGETLIEKARFNLQLAQMWVTTRDNWIIVGFRVSIESICESGHGRWPGRARRARSRLHLRNHSHTLDEICWYHWWFNADKMRASVFDAAVEKRANLSLVDGIGHLRRRLFVTDKSTNFDRSWASTRGGWSSRGLHQRLTYKLSAAWVAHLYLLRNGDDNFKSWMAIIRMALRNSRHSLSLDFLEHYGLLVDLKNSWFMNQLSNLAHGAECLT